MDENKTSMISNHKDNDEIDLVELFMKIWKWKWLTLGIMIVTTAIAIIMPLQHIYTAKTSLSIGTVGTHIIDTPEMIINSLKNMIYIESNKQGWKINDTTVREVQDKFDASVTDSTNKLIFKIKSFASKKSIDYSIQSGSAKDAERWAKKIGEYFINRHRPIYDKNLKQAQYELAELKRMNIIVDEKYISMKLLFDNQNFPTEYIIKPQIPSEPDPSIGNRMIVRIGIALFSSMLLGIFSSLLIDYIITIKNEIKIRYEKE